MKNPGETHPMDALGDLHMSGYDGIEAYMGKLCIICTLHLIECICSRLSLIPCNSISSHLHITYCGNS